MCILPGETISTTGLIVLPGYPYQGRRIRTYRDSRTAPYGYTEPKTLWVSRGCLGFWVLDFSTLEISDSERIGRALRQHKILSVPLNKWRKWAHESRQYLRCYNESRDEWVIIHSFFCSFHKYLLSTLCVRHEDKIEDYCPRGTHKRVTNMKKLGGAWY